MYHNMDTKWAKKAGSGHQMIGKIAVGYHDSVHIDIPKYQKNNFALTIPLSL